jgi:hypothetical protein
MWLPAGIRRVAYAPLPRTSPVGLVSMHSAGLMGGPELGTPSWAYSRPLQQQQQLQSIACSFKETWYVIVQSAAHAWPQQHVQAHSSHQVSGSCQKSKVVANHQCGWINANACTCACVSRGLQHEALANAAERVSADVHIWCTFMSFAAVKSAHQIALTCAIPGGMCPAIRAWL